MRSDRYPPSPRPPRVPRTTPRSPWLPTGASPIRAIERAGAEP
jgi:hypothetical protein